MVPGTTKLSWRLTVKPRAASEPAPASSPGLNAHLVTTVRSCRSTGSTARSISATRPDRSASPRSTGPICETGR